MKSNRKTDANQTQLFGKEDNLRKSSQPVEREAHETGEFDKQQRLTSRKEQTIRKYLEHFRTSILSERGASQSKGARNPKKQARHCSGDFNCLVMYFSDLAAAAVSTLELLQTFCFQELLRKEGLWQGLWRPGLPFNMPFGNS